MMWLIPFIRLRTWLLLTIALPLARVLVHRLAVTAGNRDPRASTAKTLRRADAAMTKISRRTGHRRAFPAIRRLPVSR